MSENARAVAHRKRRPRIAPAVASVAVGILTVFLAITTVMPSPTTAGWLGLVIVAVALLGLVRITYIGEFSPAAVTLLAFAAVWVGFAPLLQIRDNRLAWPDLPLYQFYVTAQVIVLCAIVPYLIGHALTRPRIQRAPAGRTEITIEKAIVVTAVATLLAAWCLPQTGGLKVRFMDRDALQAAIDAAGLRSGQDQSLLGLLSILPSAVSVVALLLCLICWRNRNWADLRARRLLLMATAVAAVLNMIYNNPLSASRFFAFSVLLAAFLAAVRIDRQRWRTAFTLSLLFGLAVLYPLANSFRNSAARGTLRFGLDAYYTFDFDGFQQTVNSVYYVDAHGHTWGHHHISALLFWVPRSLWEGKAIGAGNVVAASRGYEFTNLALPYWTEVYLEFSLVGVIVLFFFYGRLTRTMDRKLGYRVSGIGTAASVLFAACQIGLLRGPLGSQVPFAASAFFTLLAATLAWRGRRWGLTRPAPLPDIQLDTARPRIAVLADWWWPDSVGGAERTARSVSQKLAESADVAVFVPGAVEKTYQDGPVTIHSVHRPFARRVHAGSRVRHALEFLTAWTVPGVASRLAQQVRDFGPDIVVAHNMARTGPWLIRQVRSDHFRYVRVYHDLSDTCWRRSRLKGENICADICGECTVKKSIMQRASPADAQAVCVSEFVRTDLSRAGVINADDALVGLPLAFSETTPAPPRRGNGDLVVGYLGRLSPVKGIEAAIRTVAAYQRTTSRPVQLLLAGEGEPGYVATINELAAKESVRIVLAGQMDADAFCAHIDVALIPSTWMEPFGRVAVETGLRGRPMLISRVGGLPESAAVSGAPYAFADFRNPEAAARALADLLAGRAEPATRRPVAKALPLVVSGAVSNLLRRRPAATVGETR
ncbi:glycosyltransferase [Actinoplanes sp. NPDC026619]|uniref:glycosyltransferase n=1 Tax=Actinoplanes sp. NPDC026619 TaxID=3155798 RepID=UPI00340C2AE7